MGLMVASLLVLPSSASLILLMGCLTTGAVVLIVVELEAVVAIYVAEVPPGRLHGGRVGVGVGEVVGIDLRHNPPNVCRVAIFPLKVGLVNSVVRWSMALQDDVLVLVVRGAFLRSEGI